MKDRFHVGDAIEVTTEVFLGALNPEEVVVDLYYGSLKTIEKLEKSKTVEMAVKEDLDEGSYIYTCTLPCDLSGRYGYTARVSPRGDDWVTFTPGLLTWAD